MIEHQHPSLFAQVIGTDEIVWQCTECTATFTPEQVCDRHFLPVFEDEDPFMKDVYDEIVIMTGCDGCFQDRADDI